MISREALEKLLILNGLEPSAPDEKIKSLLFQANWNESDVATALSVLRENAAHDQRVDTIHKIFRSDERLSPENISSLLGISVDYSDFALDGDSYNRRGGLTMGTFVSITLIALGLSLLLGIVAMYMFQFGIFHPSNPVLNLFNI